MKKTIISFPFSATLILITLLGVLIAVDAAEIDRSTIKVTASSWEQKAKGGWADMPPERAIDGDLNTAWMAEGDGEWIQFDFGKAQALKAVASPSPKGTNGFIRLISS